MRNEKVTVLQHLGRKSDVMIFRSESKGGLVYNIVSYAVYGR